MPTKLVWDSVERATHYKVYRKIEGEAAYSDVATIGESAIALAPLLDGILPRIMVYFQVCAWDPGLGIGGYLSNEVIVRVPFPQVQNLRVE